MAANKQSASIAQKTKLNKYQLRIISDCCQLMAMEKKLLNDALNAKRYDIAEEASKLLAETSKIYNEYKFAFT